MTMRWRNAPLVLGMCGLCASVAASCKDPEPVYLGHIYASGAGGGGGSGGAAGTGGQSVSSSDSTGGGGCPETCYPVPTPSPWYKNGYVLLWRGAPDETPLDCPDNAPTNWWNGYANLVPTACPQCTCQPPQGSCSLPATLKAYYSPCPPPANTPFESFDPPMNWDGSCTTVNPVTADPSCSGTTCIRASPIDPPVVNDPPACAPGPSTPTTTVPPYWANKVRMCRDGNTQQQLLGCDAMHFCALSLSPGFMACIQAKHMTRREWPALRTGRIGSRASTALPTRPPARHARAGHRPAASARPRSRPTPINPTAQGAM